MGAAYTAAMFAPAPSAAADLLLLPSALLDALSDPVLVIGPDARLERLNRAALRRLVAGGTQLREFPKDVMVAAQNATFKLYDEFSAKYPRFKKVYTQWKKFRDDEYLWFKVAERAYDSFVFSQGARR